MAEAVGDDGLAPEVPEEELVAELEATVAGLQAQLDRVRRERDALAREAEEGRRRLDAVYATRTWRLGRALLYPPYRLKQQLQRSPAARRLVTRLRGGSVAPQRVAAIAAGVRMQPVEGLRATPREDVAAAYRDALARDRFTPGTGRVVMAVSSRALHEGRGDLYTAIGLGRELEALGYEVIYRDPPGWYDLPEHTDLVIGLIAERTATFDPALLPRSVGSRSPEGGSRRVRTLAWVRNQTQRWTALPTFPLFDAVACSSTPSLRAVRRVHAGPHLLLPIAVDERLFRSDGEERRDAAVTTVNAWSRERELHRTLVEAGLEVPLAMFGRTDGLPAPLRAFAQGPASFFALPSIYASATLVLDDLQDVNRSYGNLNSRVYESLACGALPIANAPSGLEEAGLGDLPVAETPEELRTTVERMRAEPAARDALVERLRRVVLARHTYGRRAEALDVFLQASVPADAAPPATLAFAPDYRATNPFQDLLASRLGERGVRAVPTDSPMALVRTGAADPARLVHHQHWTATILGPATTRRDADRRCAEYLAELDELKARGGRVVWTVHNTLPHECAFPDVERRLQQGIADRADAVHVMCAETAALLRGVADLPPERTHVIPHGSYVDVYPNAVEPRHARLELGLDPDDIVLLSLGGIRPYRGVDLLLDAFEEASRADRRLRLLVAGRPGRDPSVPALKARCEAHPRIVPYFEEVPDVDLQVFFNAADVAVFSHRAVLNSGGVLLAWSFGRPVIAPLAGCLTRQLQDGGGIGYAPDRTGALADALRQAGTLTSPDARRTAFARAHAHTHLDMARTYAGLITGLLTPAPDGQH